MSAGMAGVIAAHIVTDSGLTMDCDVYWRCSCGPLFITAQTQVGDHIYDHATHLAYELTKAGYGKVRTWPGRWSRCMSRTPWTCHPK